MKNRKMFYAVCCLAVLWRDSRSTGKSRPCTNLLQSDLARIHESDEGWHVVIRDILQDNDGALMFIKRQHCFKVRTASRQHELQINTEETIIIKSQPSGHNKFNTEKLARTKHINVIHLQQNWGIPEGGAGTSSVLALEAISHLPNIKILIII